MSPPRVSPYWTPNGSQTAAERPMTTEPTAGSLPYGPVLKRWIGRLCQAEKEEGRPAAAGLRGEGRP